MKKTISYKWSNQGRRIMMLISILFLNTFLMKAQEQQTRQKGQWMLGQSFHFSVENDQDNSTYPPMKTFNINYQGSVAYTVLNRLALGMLINYNYYNQRFKEDNLSYYESQSTEVGPMVRFYPFARFFLEAASKVNVAYTKMNEKQEATSFQHQIGLGYAYFISPSVAIEPKITYQIYTSDNLSYAKNKTSFLIGFQIIL